MSSKPYPYRKEGQRILRLGNEDRAQQPVEPPAAIPSAPGQAPFSAPPPPPQHTPLAGGDAQQWPRPAVPGGQHEGVPEPAAAPPQPPQPDPQAAPPASPGAPNGSEPEGTNVNPHDGGQVEDLASTAVRKRLADVRSMAEDMITAQMPPRRKFESWLSLMVKAGASDLILRAGGRPSTRVDGRIGFLPGRVPGAGALLEIMEGVMGPERVKNWRDAGSVDAALQLDGLGRFRLNAYKQMGEPALVLRRVSDQPPELGQLELPYHELTKVAMRKRGLVLVTGVAGSGKSTSLAGMIQYMNTHSQRHVITLEDPIEMLFTENRCVISQREVGIDCPDFQEGLRHALRQSPDVILIGEMRDRETVTAALDASETGHLVLSTMHTVNAAQTLDRILGFYPAEQHKQVRARLSDNMACVLSQRLVPRATGEGQVPAFEMMTSTPHIRELLAEGNTGDVARAIEAGSSSGLISFNQSLLRLVQDNLVELKDALHASDKPDELVLILRGITQSSER